MKSKDKGGNEREASHDLVGVVGGWKQSS
jgi:hypothetical protein